MRRFKLGPILVSMLILGGFTGAEESRTYRGSYDWNNGGSDELTVTFRPDGESQWQVEFQFEFDGKRQIWKGTAEGSLAGGVLKGRVDAARAPRVFVFEGAFKEGTFTGTHAELKRNKPHPSGTLTFGPKARDHGLRK